MPSFRVSVDVYRGNVLKKYLLRYFKGRAIMFVEVFPNLSGALNVSLPLFRPDLEFASR